MNRRDAITSLSLAGGASLIPSGEALAGALVAEAHRGVRAGGAGHGAGQDPRHQDDPDGAEPHPPRRRQGRDDRAGAGRLGLRDVHAARARRPDGDRRVPEAVPHRPQRRRDRGHLAVELHELVLAQRPGAVQRDERRRHRAVGHQGQARRACRSTSCSAARSGTAPTATTTPAAPASPRSRRPRAPAWSAASATSACRSARPAMPATARAARADAAATATKRSGRPTRGRSGSRRRTCACCRSSSSTCAPSSATRWSCCTTSTSASRSTQAINLCKALEPYRLFFLEDPFPPEENDHFRLLRQQTSIPIAMGELFNTQHEYLPLIKERLIDFIRIHISQIGGLSPARKVAALSEFFGVRTAWHGPGDASPLAHAAQLALELAATTSACTRAARSRKRRRTCSSAARRSRTATCSRRRSRAWASRSTRSWRRSSRFPAGPPNFDYSWGTTRRRDGRSSGRRQC